METGVGVIVLSGFIYSTQQLRDFPPVAFRSANPNQNNAGGAIVVPRGGEGAHHRGDFTLESLNASLVEGDSEEGGAEEMEGFVGGGGGGEEDVEEGDPLPTSTRLLDALGPVHGTAVRALQDAGAMPATSPPPALLAGRRAGTDVVHRVTLALAPSPLLRLGGTWPVREALVVMALTLPPRRLRLWLDVAFAYVLSPHLRGLLTEEQLAAAGVYASLHEKWRGAIGMAAVLHALRPGPFWSDAADLLRTISTCVRPYMCVDVSGDAGETVADPRVRTWLTPGGGGGTLTHRMSSAGGVGGASVAPLRLACCALTPAAQVLVDDAASLMLGLGPAHDTRQVLGMVLGLAGLTRLAQPTLPPEPWSNFSTRAEWQAYAAAVRYRKQLLDVVVRAYRKKDDAVARPLAVGLMRSVLAHALKLPAFEAVPAGRRCAYEWRAEASSLGIGPDIELTEVHARPRHFDAHKREYTFNMPLGDRPACLRGKDDAHLTSPVVVYCAAMLTTASVLRVMASAMEKMGQGSREPFSPHDLVCDLSAGEAIDTPRQIALCAARLCFFVAMIEDENFTPGLHGLQVSAWEFVEETIPDSASAIEWFRGVEFPAHVLQDPDVAAYRRAAFATPTRPQRAVKPRFATFSLQASKGPDKTAAAAFISNNENFVSPQTFCVVKPAGAGQEAFQMQKGKARAMYWTTGDGFPLNVERFVVRELVRNRELRAKILKLFAAGVGSDSVDADKASHILPPGSGFAKFPDCMILPENLRTTFIEDGALCKFPPAKGTTAEPLYCDENIFIRAKHDGFTAIFSENQLLPVLAYAVCFHALCKGRWKHPFASHPTEAPSGQAGKKRRERMEEELKRLASLDRCEFAKTARRSYEDCFGVDSPKCRWDLLDGEAMEQLAHALGPVRTVMLCRTLVHSPEHTSVGSPDICMFSSVACHGKCAPTEGADVCFVEVKSHTDKLHGGQRSWLQFMLDVGIPAGLLQFV